MSEPELEPEPKPKPEPKPLKTHWGASKEVTEAILECLESALKRLVESQSKSLLKKFFTREIVDKLKMKTSKFGATLQDCIDPGVNNLELEIGLTAVDPDCYRVYADLFVPIIEAYHKIEKDTPQPGIDNWGFIPDFRNVDPNGEHVVSTGVTCFRNLRSYPFSPLMSATNFREIEAKLCIALGQLSGELSGNYYPLGDIPENTRYKFIAENYFKDGKRFIGSADGNRYWPSGRGLYYNPIKTFMAYIGEQDHIILVSKQPGGNVGAVFKRLITALETLQEWVEFSTDERFGYLTSCPSNVGQAIRPYFHIKIPKLASDRPRLIELAAKYDMAVREIIEEPINMHGIYELYNAKRLGTTEYHSVKVMTQGVIKIIEAEKAAPPVDYYKLYGHSSSAEQSGI
ncbi:unnamed protein product [Ceutorhynchus assimilis]|uniref:arginine kinase n=1 Tax=Ceutorhynchus assimilis TaxID=467358 RepID=A0A9N9QE84_9CUCU|nr:unnamed protein product [Ceutorhynchus assimilis]